MHIMNYNYMWLPVLVAIGIYSYADQATTPEQPAMNAMQQKFMMKLNDVDQKLASIEEKLDRLLKGTQSSTPATQDSQLPAPKKADTLIPSQHKEEFSKRIKEIQEFTATEGKDRPLLKKVLQEQQAGS